MNSTVRDVMTCIDHNAKGIALVVDDERRLVDTLTDGDLRRSILAGIRMEANIQKVIDHKATYHTAKPITAQTSTTRGELLEMMHEHPINQIPILDEDGRVVDLVVRDDLMPHETLPLQAVVMAGGYGTRLRPLTEDLPKPMLPVGDRPIMEHIIEQLRHVGINKVNVTTHYKPEAIKAHFGDGAGFGIQLSYVEEDRPLGTAGALGIMEMSKDPLLVINGDILTRVDFKAMLDYHREHEAMLTVGVRQYDINVPFGVLESDGVHVTGIREKPLLNFFVSAGVYLVEPSIREFIPNGERFDMSDLIQRLIDEDKSVVNFPLWEYWLDIGEEASYAQAQKDIKSGRLMR
ncbi:MAG: nucleotidyltransferase family protein [Fidelibacterota bacterium]|nr:MAG: nucleotidyltransferase family protein [Candidatus Neomarinimicrobiota bacterium]